MKRRIFISILLIVLLISCKEGKRNLIKPESTHIKESFNINLKNIKNTYISVDKLIDTVLFIPLGDFQVNPIASIHKIIKIDSVFIIVDKSLHTVNLYKDNGAFINKIHKFGQGPGEYLSIEDCRYNAIDSTIEIIDKAATLRVYDLLGNIKNEKRNFGDVSFHPLDTNTYAIYLGALQSDTHNINGRLCYYNIESQTNNNSFLPFNRNALFPYSGGEYFYVYNDTLHLVDPILPFVYSLTKSKPLIKYKIEFSPKKYNVEIKNGLKITKSQIKNILQGKSATISSLTETKRFIHIIVALDNKISTHLYDKTDKSVENAFMGFYIEKLRLNLFFGGFQIDNNSMAFYVESDMAKSIQKQLLKEPNVDKNDMLVKSFLSLNIEEYDNPVIVIIKLKE